MPDEGVGLPAPLSPSNHPQSLSHDLPGPPPAFLKPAQGPEETHNHRCGNQDHHEPEHPFQANPPQRSTGFEARSHPAVHWPTTSHRFSIITTGGRRHHATPGSRTAPTWCSSTACARKQLPGTGYSPPAMEPAASRPLLPRRARSTIRSSAPRQTEPGCPWYRAPHFKDIEPIVHSRQDTRKRFPRPGQDAPVMGPLLVEKNR